MLFFFFVCKGAEKLSVQPQPSFLSFLTDFFNFRKYIPNVFARLISRIASTFHGGKVPFLFGPITFHLSSSSSSDR